jgi:hypothetical protein
MSTTAPTLTERRYGEVRADAVRSIAEGIVLDPPEEPTGIDVAVAVREWTDDHYEDRLGGYDPSAVESVVPGDPDDVDTSASTPLAEVTDERRRQELYAIRTVRADLTEVLQSQVAYLRRAIVVHDALERLVGHHGDRTDRRPSGLVAAFAEWVGTRRGEPAAERAREAFTPLHAVRIDALDVVAVRGPAPERGLLRALEAWLSAAHPEVADPEATTPPGGSTRE